MADHTQVNSLPVWEDFHTQTHTPRGKKTIKITFPRIWDNFWKKYCNNAELWNLHLPLLCTTTTYIVCQKNKKNFQPIYHNLPTPIFFFGDIHTNWGRGATTICLYLMFQSFITFTVLSEISLRTVLQTMWWALKSHLNRES